MERIKQIDKLIDDLQRAQAELGRTMDFVDLLITGERDSKSTVADYVGVCLAEINEGLKKVEHSLTQREAA